MSILSYNIHCYAGDNRNATAQASIQHPQQNPFTDPNRYGRCLVRRVGLTIEKEEIGLIADLHGGWVGGGAERSIGNSLMLVNINLAEEEGGLGCIRFTRMKSVDASNYWDYSNESQVQRHSGEL